jgi:integrase
LIVRRLKSKLGEHTQASSIRPGDIRDWLSIHNGGASRNLHLALAKELFNRAVEDGLIGSNPAAGIKSEKLAKPIRKTPSFDEFCAIVQSIREQIYSDTAEESADFVEFLGLAGLGQAEASALTWADVDFERNQIITFRQKTKQGFAVPLYPQLRPLLEKRTARTGNDRVFKVSNAKKAIAAACKRLGFPAYSHRSFRRMFITRALEKGIPANVVAQWQGHKDGGKLILTTYAHVRTEHSDQMAALMS